MDAEPRQSPERIELPRLILLQVITLLLMGVAMFLPAGTIGWMRGWLFLVIYSAITVLAIAYLLRVNPEVIVARSRWHQGTKRWDLFLTPPILVAFPAILVVAALDDGRFHWFPLPWWICVVGYVLLLFGFGGLAWASAVNKFFEPTVRIQADRGQTVIQAGPYAFVRHPGYASGLPMFAGMALALGSLWALIPGALAWLLLLIRARWEDAMLQAELSGYRDYAQKVRYKVIPGVW